MNHEDYATHAALCTVFGSFHDATAAWDVAHIAADREYRGCQSSIARAVLLDYALSCAKCHEAAMREEA